MSSSLADLARDVDRAARRTGERIVLAESCTAGLVAHTLSLVPGVSGWFCGSAVVYRTATKNAWLGVDADLLADPARGPVCVEAAAALCAGVLASTPEATLAAVVTGHLGPNAPTPLDGRVFVGIQRRGSAGPLAAADVTMHVLSDAVPSASSAESLRTHRQREAAALVLQRLLAALDAGAPHPRR